MDPFTIVMGVASLAGLATEIFGADKSYEASKDAANISNQIAGVQNKITGVEQQENMQRYLAMIYQSKRNEMENLRKTQQAAAQATSNAANTGGLYGTSVKEAQGADVAKGAFNTEGIRQGVQTGTTMFGLSNQITGYQMEETSLQGRLATAQGNIQQGQGLFQLGSGIMGAAQPLGKLAGVNWGKVFGG